MGGGAKKARGSKSVSTILQSSCLSCWLWFPALVLIMLWMIAWPFPPQGASCHGVYHYNRKAAKTTYILQTRQDTRCFSFSAFRTFLQFSFGWLWFALGLFEERVSLYSQGWPQICQFASASRVLGLYTHTQPTWLLVVEMLFLCKKESLVSVLLLNTIFNTLLGELVKELLAVKGHQIGKRRESLFFKDWNTLEDVKVDRKWGREGRREGQRDRETEEGTEERREAGKERKAQKSTWSHKVSSKHEVRNHWRRPEMLIACKSKEYLFCRSSQHRQGQPLVQNGDPEQRHAGPLKHSWGVQELLYHLKHIG